MQPLKKDEENLVILKGVMTEEQADKLWDWAVKLGVRGFSMKTRGLKGGEALAIDAGIDSNIK